MTPNTDNPDKTPPLENQPLASGVYKPQANQGDDELDDILGDKVFYTDETAAKVIAWKDRQLAERLQVLLDKLPYISDEYGSIRAERLRDVITELMPKEAS